MTNLNETSEAADTIADHAEPVATVGDNSGNLYESALAALKTAGTAWGNNLSAELTAQRANIAFALHYTQLSQSDKLKLREKHTEIWSAAYTRKMQLDKRTVVAALRDAAVSQHWRKITAHAAMIRADGHDSVEKVLAAVRAKADASAAARKAGQSKRQDKARNGATSAAKPTPQADLSDLETLAAAFTTLDSLFNRATFPNGGDKARLAAAMFAAKNMLRKVGALQPDH